MWKSGVARKGNVGLSCSLLVPEGEMKEVGLASELQMLLAVIALTPEPGEGPKLPVQVALARLDRISKEAQADGAR